jgi:hypothetical protein
MIGRRNKLRQALVYGFSLSCLVALMLSAPHRPSSLHAQSRVGQVVASGGAVSQEFTVRVQGPVRGPLLKSPPANLPARNQERTQERKHPSYKTPIDPTVRPEDIRPTNAETVIKSMPESQEAPPAVPQVPGTFTLYRNSAPGSTPGLPGAMPPTGFSPYEPSVGANGRVAFYTTNNYAAVSGDRGQTFSFINPFDNFPADGTVDALNGGFGGDQYVYYERTRGLMCWLIQYNPDNTTNSYRLAIARSQADLLNNTWIFYDFTPATFGLTTPAGAAGIWLDFPDLSASDNFLYFTANYFPRRTATTGCVLACPGGTCPAGCASCTGCGSLGAVIARLPLTQLAQGANLGGNFFNDTTHFSLRLTQGAHDTMYWGSHNSNTQVRIYRWPENGNIAFDDVNHAAYNGPGRGGHNATCTGGTDYLANDDDRVLGAWVANGVIGLMWDAAQGGGFARPHVQVLRFNEDNRSLLTQGQIFSATIAFAYPSVHPNDRGHLGGTIAFGCGASTGNPGAAAWIADDFNNNTITPLETAGINVGNRAEGRWGDYFATRIYSPYGNTWVGTGFALNTPNLRDHRFVWFGRERDTPPPTNVIFVSFANNTGYEDGTLFHPYNTVGEGHFAALPGDVISIVPANYNELLRLNRPSRIERLGATGTVRIGRP